MSIFKAKTENPYKHQIMKELKEHGLENAKPSEILDHLFGDSYGRVQSRYTIRRYTEVKTTTLQRFNLLWVYPLFLIAAPFRWILFGEVGFKTESATYRLLEKLIGKF